MGIPSHGQKPQISCRIKPVMPFRRTTEHGQTRQAAITGSSHLISSGEAGLNLTQDHIEYDFMPLMPPAVPSMKHALSQQIQPPKSERIIPNKEKHSRSKANYPRVV